MGSALLSRSHVFEKGDKVYLTTPLTLASVTEGEIEEFAFASAIKTKAPNENIGWLQGRYVEAGRPNLNGAMWLSDELALKSLTPMLMPVTVMHDPRTAVGTIADAKFVEENSAARIDNILAIWKHRFPDVWEEAEHNIDRGEMMESMECYAPWYTCSHCETSFVKLPQGAERASWCDHLRAGDSWRILRDVCFTGTGLIFGSRGGVGAYTEAYLDHFHDEIAEYHDRAHADSTYKPSSRSTSHMALIQIEESELATLRQERNDARAQVETLQTEKRDLTGKVETAEAAKVQAETERDEARTELKTAQDEKAAADLKSKRWDALGAGFLAKLGDTSKAVLGELASKASDEEWETALKEREELAGAKRDAAAPSNGSTPPAGGGGGGGGETPSPSAFESEEVAGFMRSGVATPAGSAPTPDGASSVRSLARSFRPKSAAGTEK